MAPKGRKPFPKAKPGESLHPRSAYSQRSHAESYAQQRADHENEDTAYGTLFKVMQLPAERAEGNNQAEPIQLWYACPFALLWKLCVESVLFYRFLKQNMARLSQPRDGQAGPSTRDRARVALYWDEVVPGNNMRPDKGRAYIAVYWTFVDLPMWFINGPIGWFSLGFVPLKLVQCIKGGVPLMNEAILRVFWPDVQAMNFANGVRLIEGQAGPADPMGFLNESFTFAADFAFFLADEAAFKKMSGAKGASGTKPCVWCQNTLGRCQPGDIADDSPMVHFTNPYVDELCCPHTPDTLSQLWLHLATKALQLRRGEFKKGAFNRLQQCAGLAFDVCSLLAPRIRELANIPYSIYWDWMHCGVASGGLGQYELNQLLLRIQLLVPLDRVQEFANLMVFPKGDAFSAKLCLADRIRKGAKKHIRAFAAEVLGWVVVVGLFCELILAPLGVLQAEVECFRLLGRIIYLLRLGNGCVAKLSLLKTLLREHHVRFMALYPAAATPKLHFLRHIPTCIERWGVLFACFATERKHRASKGIAAFAFRAWCVTLVRRVTRQHLEQALLAENFCPEKLDPPKGKAVLPHFQSLLQRAGILGQAELARMATRARTPAGKLWKGDLLGVREAGELCAGFAVQFFAVTGAVGEQLFALVQVLRPLGGSRFSRAEGHTELGFMPLSSVLHAFPYLTQGSDVYLVASLDEFT